MKLKGYTVVPTSLYLEKGKAKLEIALARGKDLHDKRNAQKEKDAKREIEKAMKIIGNACCSLLINVVNYNCLYLGVYWFRQGYAWYRWQSNGYVITN